MDVVQAIIFLVAACILLALTLLAILRQGFLRLESSIGIARDGLPIGAVAPALSLPDLAGRAHAIPSMSRWQFLVFGDRSLVAFPGVVSGVNILHALATAAQEGDDLEVLILSRDSPELCWAMAEGLGLEAPAIPVDQAVYTRFHVRVSPFACLIDPRGIVQWKGLINTADQMVHAWRLTRALHAGRDTEMEATR